MKTAILLSALLLASCGGKNYCESDTTIAEFAHKEALQHFPYPDEVNFDMEDIIVNDHGDKVVRGRVQYRTALGEAAPWPNYYISVHCEQGQAAIMFVEVAKGGPKWTRIK